MNEIISSVDGNRKTLKIELPNHKYINKALKWLAWFDLSPLFLRCVDPVKEITESVSAYVNINKYCDINKSINLHIGDGGTPRTAALFSFITKSLNFSIDPDMNMNFFNNWSKSLNLYPKRLKVINDRWQNVNLKNINICNVILVHSHVNVNEIDNNINWILMYTNPCCYPEKQTFSEQYMKDNNIYEVENFDDYSILSDHRNVRIYVNIKNINKIGVSFFKDDVKLMKIINNL